MADPNAPASPNPFDQLDPDEQKKVADELMSEHLMGMRAR